MDKAKKPNSIDLIEPLKKLTKRFHLTLFFVVLTAGLSFAILSINDTLKDSSAESGYVSPINAGSIDQATLTRLSGLRTSTEDNPAHVLPTGRTNPVNE